MMTFGKMISTAMAAKDLSQGAVARALGVSSPAIGKIVRDETRRPDIWRRLVDYLGLDPVEAEKLLPPAASHRGRASADNVLPFAPRPQPTMIPVLGHAAAGDPDRLVMIAEQSDSVPAVPSVAGVDGAYALYVYGPSMVPRYYPGELVFVHPRKPLTPDCFCVIQVGATTPEGAFIKQFKSWAGGKLIVQQFNPEKTIEFDSSDVFDVHRIVGSGDD